MDSQMQDGEVSKGAMWAGRIISGLVVLLLIFDGATKVMKVPAVIKQAEQMGFAANTVAGIGAVLLVCLAIYLIPQTSVLGAILLTAYLGGAVATLVVIRQPLAMTAFPIICGVFVWAGLFFRDARIRALIPVRR